jgi:glycosyltransferase 2 family protein
MMPGIVKKIARFSFGFILLGYFLSKVNLSHTTSTIFSIPFSTVTVSILIYIFSVWISAVKWCFLLPRYTVLTLAKICLIGLYYNLILPGQLAGEGVKGYFLIKKGDARQVVASIVFDKITGLIGLLIVALAGIWFSRQIIVQDIAYILAAFTLFCVLFLFVLRNQHIFSFILGLFSFIGKRIPQLYGISSHLTQILHDCRTYLQKPALLIKMIVLGILFQLSGVMIVMIMARGIEIQTPFADLCWILGIISIAILIPLTIGGIGIREGAFIGLLGQVGVPSEKALALSLSIFTLQIFLSLIGGFLGHGIGFKRKESHDS